MSGSSTNSAIGFVSKIKENSSLADDQLVTVGVTFKKILNACCTYNMGIRHGRKLFKKTFFSSRIFEKFHLLGSVPEIIALVGSCSGQEVLNDSHTNVVTHTLQLPIHVVDILVILGKRYVCNTIVPLTNLDDDYLP